MPHRTSLPSGRARLRSASHRHLTARLLASVAALALLTATAPAMAQTVVGTAAAVNPRSTGVAGSGTRVLELGSSIIHRERVQTGGTGSVQVLFVDKTTLNIGPGSDLLIDEFVYDPNAKTGSMAVSLTKGAVRFVGGNASHTGGATVKTPVATIGIRGGVAGIIHQNGQTQAILQFGTLTVTGPGGQSTVVRRPGFMVVVGPNGIVGPTRVSQQQVDTLLAQTLSRHGQNGGRPEHTPDIPTIDKAASHPCSAPVQGQTLSPLAVLSCRYVNTDIQDAADTIAQQAAQEAANSVLIPPVNPCIPYCYIVGP